MLLLGKLTSIGDNFDTDLNAREKERVSECGLVYESECGGSGKKKEGR